MKQKSDSSWPVALTIAGSDSGGGAGIQADLRAFHAHGVYGTSAVTCLTAQNPDGVARVDAMDPAMVRSQIRQVQDYFCPTAVKTGMLFNAEIIHTVAEQLMHRRPRFLVVDPVMVATSGAVLLESDAIESLCAQLLPMADLMTPNLDEAAVLLGRKAGTVGEMKAAAQELHEKYRCSVLLKGGHLEGLTLTDVLCVNNDNIISYEQPRRNDINTHGSGCTLASAIAARMARGEDISEAVSGGIQYLRRAMGDPVMINGIAFIRH